MKKKTMKLFAVMIAILVAAFTLAACGGGSGGNSNSGGGDATEAAAPADDGADATEAAAPAAPSGDAEFTFKVTYHQPEKSATGQFVQKWCDTVTEQSDGRIQFQIFSGGSLAPATESYNMVKSGGADIAWGLPSFYQGTFPLTDATGLPFTAKDIYQGSYAMWDLYENSEAIQNEWKDVHLILLHSNCDCSLLVKNPRPESVEDLAGRQCRFVGGTSTDLANDLGIVAVNVNVQDIYESLEKGVIDSAANCGWDLIASNNFTEPVDAIWNIKMNINPCFFIMNNAKYDSLPDDLKAVIDANSGMAAAEMVVPYFADIQTKMMSDYADMIYEPDEATVAKFQELGKGVADRWCESMGDEGKAVYDMWIQYLADHEGDIVFK